MKTSFYPVSRIATVEDNYHGTIIRDDFRWLEGDENGRVTPEVAAWTDQQNSLTRSLLDSLPGRASLKGRLKPLLENDSCWLPVFAGGRIFYFRREGSRNQPSLYMAESVWAPEKLLLDPDQLDPSGLTTIGWFEPSADGELLAYGTYASGDENYQLRIMRTADLSHLPDILTNKVVGVFWLPDSSGFIYSRLAEPANPYSREIRFHRPGDKPDNDRLIFAQYREGPLATTWGPSARLSEDGRWMILSYHTSTRSNNLWLADFTRWLETGSLDLREVIVDSDSSSCARVINDRLFILSNDGASNSRIFTAPLHAPGRINWQVLVPEQQDAVIENWDFTGDALLIEYQRYASSNLVRFDLKTGISSEIDLPGIGTANFSCSPGRPDVFINFTSFDCPNKIFHHDFSSGQRKSWWERAIGADLSAMVVTRQKFASKDGTTVSMFLLHRKGITLDGNNPTLIYGYGGFAISMTPAFSGPVLPWVEDGGVYAVVNLRGGGEYGDDWHRMGTLGNKKKVFEDLEAAAEWLIDKGYTRSSRLAVSGRSNGGLLVGAALTRRPDLYRAVICGVPLLDMLRYQKFLMARYWVPEYGTAEDQDQFAWLREYSPFHNIEAGRQYPAVFFHTAENDTRVHPMHARKMAAALQTFAANDRDRPLLLWVEREAGHGMGKPLAQILEDQTDQWMFLRWQLGMD